MSAYVMRRRVHPPVSPSGEPARDALAQALRLAEKTLARMRVQAATDPADVAASNRAFESVEVS